MGTLFKAMAFVPPSAAKRQDFRDIIQA